jgi:hypothetical protein
MDETDPALHPYSLQVVPHFRIAGSFQWTIRKHGKVLQRSDRPHPSEDKARRDGLAVIERLLQGDEGFVTGSGSRTRH